MNSAVKIIKRSKNEALTELQAGQDEMAGQPSTRQIARTVKGWIGELHRRRREEQLESSASRTFRVA